MFERFTDRARQTLILARQEARAHNHDHIDTEHLLLGVLGAGESTAGKVLESLGISPETIRQQVEKTIRRGRKTVSERIPFTAQAKKVIELSLREALQLGHNYIGTEHILLGLISEGQGVAAKALAAPGITLEAVRQQVEEIISQGQQSPSANIPATPD